MIMPLAPVEEKNRVSSALKSFRKLVSQRANAGIALYKAVSLAFDEM